MKLTLNKSQIIIGENFNASRIINLKIEINLESHNYYSWEF